VAAQPCVALCAERRQIFCPDEAQPAQRRIGRHRLQLGPGLGECDEVVVMELDAPAFVRGVLREHGLPHGVTDRVLPSGIGADLAAEHADRNATGGSDREGPRTCRV
jgi:hypothetical protein